MAFELDLKPLTEAIEDVEAIIYQRVEQLQRIYRIMPPFHRIISPDIYGDLHRLIRNLLALKIFGKQLRKKLLTYLEVRK